MTDSKIKQMAFKYRIAIENAKVNGALSTDLCFKHFPLGCCGDTCYLLAEFFRRAGVETVWYSAQRNS